jgi:two-component system, cell cycle sensor histidine kinase and response regulator CckA
MELFFDRLTNQPVYPFLPAFAAIIAIAAFAGSGPGIASSLILVGWAAFDLFNHGHSASNIFWRCLIFFGEGVVLSVGSAKMWNSKRQAHRSEAWHRRLVETAAEGIWVQSDRGVVTWANTRMAEMLGVSAEDLVGRKAEDFFLPADLAAERIRAGNLRHGRKEQFDRRLRRSDGSEIWVLASTNLIEGEDGEPRCALAMMTDITERKSAEHALRRSEERFRNLFEGVLEGVYQSTPGGRVLAANPMLLRMLGLASPAELNDINIANDLYVDPNVRKRLLERLEREGGFQNVEYELRRRDGRIISVLENARVIRDDTGAVDYYEGTLTDITPRKRIEEQLRQAQKVQAMGRLAGGIAQDFNNVLTVVTGYAQLVLTELDPRHPARLAAEQLREAAGSAIELTRQLLSFSRRQISVHGSADLNRAVERSRPALQLLLRDPMAGDRVGLVISPCKEDVPVDAGPEQIELIVLSFAACLRSVAPLAGLELKTQVADLDENICRRCGDIPGGLYGVLSVSGLDEGMHGDEDPLDFFADPGFTPLNQGRGTPKGLSSTHSIITQCGGFIAARERSLHAFLPCSRTPAPAGSVEFMETAGGETILLVEDEPLVRELSRDLLERQGYRVVLACDAKEAERISANAGSFDLLITDSVMPNTTGPELARRIRAAHPGLKVLFIAGYTDEPPSREACAEGTAFLQKPFSAESLGRKIRQVLRRA